MLEICTKRTYLGWLLGGLFFGFAFFHVYSWPLVFPALWFFLICAEKSNNLKKLLLGLLIFTLFKYMGSLAGVWYSYPSDLFTHVSEYTRFILVFLYWSVCSLFPTVGFVLVILTSRILVKNTKWWLMSLPFIWVLAEVAGSATFSIGMLGAGSSININFGFGYVGYLVSDIPFILSLAKLGGVYVLSFFVVALVVLLYGQSKGFFKKLHVALTVLIFLLLLTYLFFYPQLEAKEELTILSIDTEFTNELMDTKKGRIEKEAVVRQSVAEALKHDVDVILLPEDSRFTKSFPSPEYALRYVVENSVNKDVVLVDSTHVWDERAVSVLRAFIYDTKTGTVSWVDKEYLTPLGEYVPHLFKLPMTQLLGEDEARSFFINYNYKPGLVVNYSNVPKHVPQLLFCMESVSPFEVRKKIDTNRPPYVLHMISHAWFRSPTSLHINLERMLKTQAVWSGVTVIEASNMKKSNSYDTKGKIGEGEVVERGDKWTLRLFK